MGAPTLPRVLDVAASQVADAIALRMAIHAVHPCGAAPGGRGCDPVQGLQPYEYVTEAAIRCARGCHHVRQVVQLSLDEGARGDRTAVLNLVDLAGSENVSATRARTCNLKPEACSRMCPRLSPHVTEVGHRRSAALVRTRMSLG